MSSKATKRAQADDDDSEEHSEETKLEWKRFVAQRREAKNAELAANKRVAYVERRNEVIVAAYKDAIAKDTENQIGFNKWMAAIKETYMKSYLRRVVDFQLAIEQRAGSELVDVYLDSDMNCVELAAKAVEDNFSGELHIWHEIYIDRPDPDGPYGFIRTYMRFHIAPLPPATGQ